MGRLLRWLMLVLMLLPLLWPSSGTAQDGQLGRLDDPEIYDLGAMLLTSVDLADAGLEGYGVSTGWTDTLDDELIQLVTASSTVVEHEFQTLLEDSGFQYSRVVQHSLPSDEDPNVGARGVTNWVNQHEESEGLSDVLDAYLAIGGDAEDVEGTGTIGDYSRIVAFRDTSSDTPTSVMLLGFVSGNHLALIQVSEYEDQLPDVEPTVEEIETLGNRLLERIETVREDGAPGLDRLPLRMESDGETSLIVEDYYVRLEGETLPAYGETAEAFEARDAEYEEAGVTSTYIMDQEIGPADGTIVRWAVRLRVHDSEDQAEAWLANEPESSTARASVDELEFEEVDGLGDGAVLATMTLPESRQAATALFFRSGTVTASLYIFVFEDGFDEDVLIDLGEQQLACIEQDGCDGEAPIPDEIVEYVEG